MKFNNKRKADIILIISLLVICAAAYLILQIFVKKPGTYVVIKVDGIVKHELDINKDTTLEISGYQGGINRVVIKNGQAYVSHADCPDDLCVHTGKISMTGETIVCLPHRVVVEITGAKQEIDAIVN